MATVERVPLGSQGLEVSAQGLGCMGMSVFYGDAKPDDEMIDLIQHAVDSGITFLDTADMYGGNELLLGKALKKVGREKVQLATKFANKLTVTPVYKLEIRGDPAYVRECIESSLRKLDVDYIDLYYQHRPDINVPIEITVGEMKKLVQEGKVKYLGLSEASADTIRRAHAVHPISAVQIEWSLWTRDAEKEIVPVCRELGIGIVPYSPLGRGFFSGLNVAELPKATDSRATGKFFPRFSEENLAKNKAFYNKLAEIASTKGATPGQLALAWLQHKGKDVIPIPGTTKKHNLDQNIGALKVTLSKEEIEEIEAAVPVEEVQGERYADMSRTYLDTPPLSSWKGTPDAVDVEAVPVPIPDIVKGRFP